MKTVPVTWTFNSQRIPADHPNCRPPTVNVCLIAAHPGWLRWPLSFLLVCGLGLGAFTARAQTEAELIRVLQSAATAVQKADACKLLRQRGTAAAVPALAPLLRDERVSQAARFALEGIAAPEAAAALREALNLTSGLLQAGIVDSLGWKRDAAAVPTLQPLLASAETSLAGPAALALGRIGGSEARAALRAAWDHATPPVRSFMAEGLLQCAEQLLAQQKNAEAQTLYTLLTAAAAPESVRVAAHAGLIRSAGDRALTKIVAALQDSDAAAQLAALQLAGEVADPNATRVFAGLLPRSSPALQIGLLALLAQRGDPVALPAVQAAAQSPESAVRTAAWAALGELGDARIVPLLAQAALSADANEQQAARTALVTLRRGEVAEALVQHLGRAPATMQVELVRALTARAETAAVPALLQLAGSDRPATQQAVFRALGQLADGHHAGALVKLLEDARDDATRTGVMGIFESLSDRLPTGQGLDTAPIVRGITKGDLGTRQALLQVCAFFASEPLRTALRAALQDDAAPLRAAAARALCDTQDPDLLPDLLTVARETADANLRSSAIEGIVRLVTDDTTSLTTEQRTDALVAANALATRTGDKRRVLSGLGRVPNATTLKLAALAAADASVRPEAEAARLAVAKQLGFRGPFIQDWQVCGPFHQPGVTGALAIFGVALGPEVPDQTVAWQSVPRTEHVNLGLLFPGAENCAAFLQTRMVVPQATDALLLIGSDDGVKAWLNDQVVHSNNVDRGDVADQDVVPVRLRQGTNTLRLKITQGSGGWSARARLVGTDGGPIAGLQPLATAPAPVAAAPAPPAPPPPKPATLPPRDNYKKLRLADQFYAEGAYYGDFNRDGKLDVVAGPFWFEGPDFVKRHEYRPVQTFDPKNYSDNFLTYTGDFNGDGWTDILCVPWPGKEGYWLENPRGQAGHWPRHLFYDMVGNESPVWGDVTGDGRPELLFNNEGRLGYAGPDPAHPTRPWIFHAVSGPDKRYQRYTHGIGFGDLNGDGRPDILEQIGWWEQPAHPQPDQRWTFHPFHFADAAAQMLVYDVNGDGFADVITAWHCHEYGLLWYEQVPRAGRAPDWKRHVILSPQPQLQSTAFRVSQLHAFDLADMNGDGLKDIVTGKRFWAHGPDGDAEPNAPAVVLWFELRRASDGQVTFVPHLIDDDSGVGTQVTAVDLNGDGRPDVVVANKKGIFLHLSQSGAAPKP
ncbi:MAG TPA: HEAT repeat domain-containing protein [Verrucomicrobiota bacterium]|nr:HEAT repeat domain-containing protein [Verrucomicrobiota bacterium]HQB15516.1 HEAT repeat domain-containing protein [Verrucomicrobiota bacterium]